MAQRECSQATHGLHVAVASAALKQLILAFSSVAKQATCLIFVVFLLSLNLQNSNTPWYFGLVFVFLASCDFHTIFFK